MPICVLLVDDHSLINEGLRRAFEGADDLQVVDAVSSVAEAVAVIRARPPDVAVIDVNLGDGNGIDLCRDLRRQYPTMGLVVLTMSDGDEDLFAALEAGASAYVLKSAPAEHVAAAVRRASTNPTSFSADDLGAAMRRRMQTPAVRLTGREGEILQLLSQGLSVEKVANRLYISPSTAKTHMSRLYEKLGAANRTQAVMAAVRLGLVDPERATG